MDKLYTFILDFRGGTYISQFRGFTPEEALKVWAEKVDLSPISGMGPKSRSKLISETRGEQATPITGIANVWCADVIIRGHLGIINIVRTSEKLSI